MEWSWEAIKARFTQANNFRSDGCTAAPDLFWKDCCKEHDFHYQNPELTGLDRLEADKRLYNCMRAKGSGRIVAWIYYRAVRMFGANFWNKKLH